MIDFIGSRCEVGRSICGERGSEEGNLEKRDFRFNHDSTAISDDRQEAAFPTGTREVQPAKFRTIWLSHQSQMGSCLDWFADRQANGKGRTLPKLAFDMNFAVMRFNDRL